MKRLLREFRLIPVVLIAIVCLFALKTLGLVLDGSYTFGVFDDPEASVPATAATRAARAPLAAPSTRLAAAQHAPQASGHKQSWAQEMFNFPDPSADASADVTGSVDPPKPPEPAKAAGPGKPALAEPKPGPQGTVVPLDLNRPVSEAERAILERLQQRREELDARARELDIRESLLKAAEKRVEARVAELKDVEGRINAAVKQKDEIEAARFKGLVTMYENMKPKDAAKIFDRLDPKVLLDVSTQINPRRMSDILAQMSPDAAERLTVELANRASMGKEQQAQQGAQLPKIEGQRNGS